MCEQDCKECEACEYDDDEPVTEPHLIESQAEIDDYPPFPFPNRCEQPEADGWEVERELFCDSSGFGQPGESALTIEQLKAELRPGFAYAITEQGQFQVYVTEYKREDRRPYCAACSVPQHDCCSMTPGCPCCDNTTGSVLGG